MGEQTLNYLKAILEEGSITSAAQRLYISQPSLSQYIKRIEYEIGAELFVRRSKSIQLTDAGKIFYEAEQNIDNIMRKRNNQIQELHELKSGKITIGSSHYRSMFLLTKVIPVFREMYPGIQIELEEGTTRYLEDSALNGNTDFSIVLLPLSSPELSYEILFREQIILALPKNHKLCKNLDISYPQKLPFPIMDFTLLNDEPFIIMKKGQNLRRYFFELCNSTNTHPKIVLQTDDMLTAQSLAGAGMGATIITDIIANSGFSTVFPNYFSINQHVPLRDVVVVYNRTRHLSRAASVFVEIMKEIISKLVSENKCFCL